jgi:hypothetical protein
MLPVISLGKGAVLMGSGWYSRQRQFLRLRNLPQ